MGPIARMVDACASAFAPTCGVYTSRTTARATTTAAQQPTAWNARAAISRPIDGASTHATLAAT